MNGSTRTPAVSLSGLTRHFGAIEAVSDVTFDVGPGEVFGMIGPNGAGKTTIIRLICGLFEPSAGGGTVFGHDIVRDRLIIRQQIGYMSQGFGLYEELTVDENISFFADVYALADHSSLNSVRDRLGLEEYRKTVVAELPTGMRQRTALAATLVHNPRLVFLDEPTSGVDPVARDSMWKLVRSLAAGGLTVIVTTHVMPEAEKCDRLALLSDGRLVAVGTQAELVTRAGITILVVEASPWQEAFARIKDHWSAASLHGRTTHIPVAHRGTAEAELQTRLAGLEVTSVKWQEPSIEDAFIELVASSKGQSDN